MRVPRPILILATPLAVLALAACGGSSGNGVASRSPDQIVSASGSAVTHAKSVHVSGTITTSGVPLTLDLSLLSGQGGRGSISEAGLSFQLVDVGRTVYIKGSPTFWQHFGGAAAARLIGDRWLKAPDSGQFASIATLTDLHQLFGALLLKHGGLTKLGTSTVNGQRVVGITNKSQGGILYVATNGPPYPVELKKQGGGGQIVFDRFNQPVTLTPPANSISLSQLG